MAGVTLSATIQYPDPHFKTKHAKRRMVQVELARAVSASLAPEGEILLQSDLEWVSAFEETVANEK